MNTIKKKRKRRSNKCVQISEQNGKDKQRRLGDTYGGGREMYKGTLGEGREE